MNLKRQRSFLLAACLLGSLAGCGTTAASTATPDTAAGVPAASSESPVGSTTAMGRWVETEISLGDGLVTGQAPALMDDGSLWQFAFDSESYQLHKLVSTDDGASWQDEPLDWNTTTGGMISRVTVSGGGSAFFEAYIPSTKDAAGQISEFSSDYWYAAPGKTAVQLDFTALMADIAPCNAFGNAYFLDDDTLLLLPLEKDENGSISFNGDIATPPVLYTLSTGTSLPLPDVKNKGFSLLGPARAKTAEGTAALNYMEASADGFQLLQVDKTGKTAALADALPQADNSSAAAADAEGNYYYTAKDGIYRLAQGGTLGEQLLSTDGTILGTQDVMGLTRTTAGDFIALMLSEASGGFSLYRYHWDATLPSEAADQLTVWSLYDSPSVRTAILEYNAADPDRGVSYTPVFAGADEAGSGQTKDDALRTLNTELLAGNGPDVLILDGVDYQPYAEKGLLAELSGMVDTAALAQNLAGPFLTGGGATVLPARFTVPVLIGNEGSLAGMTSLTDLQKAVEALAPRPDVDANSDSYYTALPEDQQYAFSFMTPAQIVEFVMQTSAPALLKDGAVDTGAVRQALGFVAAVATRYDMKNYRPADEQMENGNTGSGGDSDPVTIWSRTDEFESSRARYGWGTMASPAFCYSIGHRSPDSEDYLPTNVAVRPGLSEGAYLPSVLTAVNAASKKAEQAGNFVATLFGETAQSTYSDEGMPMLQSALDASVARNAGANNGKIGKSFRGDVPALLAACKTPVIINDTVNAAMLTHAEALIDGSEDLDAAVSGVESDLALYLAEQQ